MLEFKFQDFGPGQDHFWAVYFLFVNQFSKCCGTFQDFWNAKEMIRLTISHLSGDVSEQGDMQKGSFQRIV